MPKIAKTRRSTKLIEHVKYDNKFNLLSFHKVSKLEMDIFFTILSTIKDTNLDFMAIDYDLLMKYIDKNITKQELVKTLEEVGKKLCTTLVQFKDGQSTLLFPIFKQFRIDYENKPIIGVQINDVFRDHFNDLKSNFTQFALPDFTSINSRYTQTLYRLLMQFKSTGLVVINIDNFRTLLDIPKSYKMIDIDKRVLKPAIKELTEKKLFENLKYRKIKIEGANKIQNIEFYFMPKTDDKKLLAHSKKSLETISAEIYTRTQLRKQKIEATKKRKLEEARELNNLLLDSDGTNIYLGRSVRIKSHCEAFDYDTLKIVSIKKNQNRIQVKLKNVDDDYLTEFSFKDETNLHNWFKKYSF